MSKAQLIARVLAAAAVVGCGSDSTGTDNNPGGGGVLPPNGISIVLGAQTKGTAAFTPNPMTISLASGGVVRWFNDDQGDGVYGGSGVTHNITADDGAFASGNLPPGATFEGTYAATGNYGYHCSIHPGMKGTVTVNP